MNKIHIHYSSNNKISNTYSKKKINKNNEKPTLNLKIISFSSSKKK